MTSDLWILVGSGIYVQSPKGVPLKVIRPRDIYFDYEAVVITPAIGNSDICGDVREHILGERDTYLGASALFGLASGHIPD